MHLERKLVLSSLALFLVLVGASFVAGKRDSTSFEASRDSRETVTVTLGASEIETFVAKDENSRARGLGGIETLVQNTGMLFIFDTSDLWGIWMKDMKISIDVIWLDEKGNIVSVEENMSPETYPKIFFPTTRSRYVLEVSAGTFRASGALRGDTIDLSGLSKNI
jgi:hypothetical protein